MGNRGASLATTLVFSTLALMVALAMSSTSVMHLHFANSQVHSKRAHSAAEAVLALALERVTKTPGFGGQGEVVTVDFEHAKGSVTFVKDEAKGYSTNNLQTESSVTGWKEAVVPPNSVHLVAHGVSGERHKTVEMIVSVPDFPYALASSGPISSEGSLLVGGLEKMEDAFPQLDRDVLLPSDLASNAAGESVKLEGQAEVTGDIQTVGSIHLGEDAVVHGQLKSFSSAVPVDRVDLAALRPSDSLPLSEGDTGSLEGSFHASQRELLISDGLHLNDGILYVNGDLTIRGGVRGRGALLVNGKVTIHDGAALSAESQVALVAKDTVKITGNEQTSSFFQGLVYTEGDLIAEDVTLMGAFVANRERSSLDPGSRMRLTDASAVHIPEYTGFETEEKVIYFHFESQGRNEGRYDGVTFRLDATEEEWNQLLEDSRESAESRGSRTAQVAQSLRQLGFLESNPDFEPDSPEDDGIYLNVLSQLLYRSTRGEAGAPTLEVVIQPAFRFDLNEFLAATSRSRVILYREL